MDAVPFIFFIWLAALGVIHGVVAQFRIDTLQRRVTRLEQANASRQ